MNWPHVHLILNHIPVLGVLFGLVLAVVAFRLNQIELKTTALSVSLLAGAGAGLVYFTGEQAEETLLWAPGISRSLVLAHDDAAFYAVVAAGSLAVLSLLALVVTIRKVPPPGWLTPTWFAVATITAVLIAWTAGLGGQIRHPEITSTPTAAPTIAVGR